MHQWEEAQIEDVCSLKLSGKSWSSITQSINHKYGLDLTQEQVRQTYKRYRDQYTRQNEYVEIGYLRESARLKRESSKKNRTNNLILKELDRYDDLLIDIEKALENCTAITLPTLSTIPEDSTKKDMVVELLISDTHMGKKTATFNSEVYRRRVQVLSDFFISEVQQACRSFNVTKIHLAFLGDLIESATMHGVESAAQCEFGNSEQVRKCVEVLWESLIIPISALGIPVYLPCVTGNHDRSATARTYNYPGRSNYTWVIYKMWQMLAKALHLRHLHFDIPEGSYCTAKIFNNTILYEHGDNSKACTYVALEALLQRRQTQLNCIVDFMRVGHFHEYNVYGWGRIITNASLVGQDSYATVMGFNTYPGQTINFYVENNTRPTCFYKSLPVFL